MIYQSVEFQDFGAIVFDKEYEPRIKQIIVDECAYLPLDVLCARLDTVKIPFERYMEQYDGGDLPGFLIRMMQWVNARCPEVRIHGDASRSPAGS